MSVRRPYKGAKVLTGLELEMEIRAAGGRNVEIGRSIYADAHYTLPTREYVEHIMLPAFEQWSKGNGLWDWKTRHDCDDKADALKVFAQQCFRHSRDTTEADGFAVWRVYYLIDADPGKGHAINAALTDEGVVFIEPQTARIVALTTEERGSIWYAY